MPTNAERAARAWDACETFADATGLSVDDELPTVIGDLIANLLHLADQDGLCAESVLRTATMHFEAETGDEKEWSQ
jgi:hypothetical protein